MPQLVALTDLMAAQSILNRFPTNTCTSFESNRSPICHLAAKTCLSFEDEDKSEGAGPQYAPSAWARVMEADVLQQCRCACLLHDATLLFLRGFFLAF
jgi:hypothetical protein